MCADVSNYTLTTERLVIRPFTPDDLAAIHPILNAAFASDTPLEDRTSWLHWSVANARELAALYQPPYGDRAIIVQATGTLIGAVGYVPCFAPFDTLPDFANTQPASGLYTPEFGLFWAIDPAHQRQGYATEAARALVHYAFSTLRLKRIVATTDYDNPASQAVMRKLGMRLARNPHATPDWFQIVGILPHPDLTHTSAPQEGVTYAS
ncbi:MAG: GNAT family N-acetyltransferase [Armatimonadetes bacterium]|nr:GNAT family N-acetyltransferase [Anaerolineae bacterium]